MDTLFEIEKIKKLLIEMDDQKFSLDTTIGTLPILSNTLQFMVKNMDNLRKVSPEAKALFDCPHCVEKLSKFADDAFEAALLFEKMRAKKVEESVTGKAPILN